MSRLSVFASIIALLLVSHAGAGKPVPIAEANNAFAFDLYRTLAADQELADQNLFFSPYSITTALDMVAEGAQAETAEEMGKVLRYPAAWRRAGAVAKARPWNEAPLHAGVAILTRRFAEKPVPAKLAAQIDSLRKQCMAAVAAVEQSEQGADRDAYARRLLQAESLGWKYDELVAKLPGHELTIANALWGEKTLLFEKEYVASVARHYGSGLQPADFIRHPEEARRKINGWIAQRTKDKIKDVLQPPSINPETRLVVVNAIYFKGKWREPFDQEFTQSEEFLGPAGKIHVAMMHHGGMVQASYAAFQADGSAFTTPLEISSEIQPETCYPDEKGFLVAELPYNGDAVVMTIFAPRSPNGLPALEKLLTAEKLREWTGHLQRRETAVTLPRFTFKTSYNLNQPLSALGMPRAFSRNTAQFDGISARGKLFLGLVQHDALVDVNEKGTEAAAVTVVAVPGAAGTPPPPFVPEFRADRPFLFLIRDRVTGAILFVGRVLKPEAAAASPGARVIPG